jgi:hypothetical protein
VPKDPPPEVTEREATPIKPPPELKVEGKKELGYLTITSNVPAYVYVDGTKIKGRTPIRKYAVQPGSRTITMEVIKTGERKNFRLSVAKGQDLKIMETFEKKSSRR